MGVPLYFAATIPTEVWGVFLSEPEEKLLKTCNSKKEAIQLAAAMNSDAGTASVEELDAAARILKERKPVKEPGVVYLDTKILRGGGNLVRRRLVRKLREEGFTPVVIHASAVQYEYHGSVTMALAKLNAITLNFGSDVILDTIYGTEKPKRR